MAPGTSQRRQVGGGRALSACRFSRAEYITGKKACNPYERGDDTIRRVETVMVDMGVKALIKSFVVLSVLAVGALTAYHHYVEEKTPSSATFAALEAYNAAMDEVVTTALDAARRYRESES